MNSAVKSFKYLKRLFISDFIASLMEDSFLYRLLVDKDPTADILRQNIDDCLELAYRYSLVDANLEARLKKGDWESWQATANELKVAKFLEGILGVDSLRWHPQGRGGKKGEFGIVSSKLDKPIFVEVKTIFPRELEALEQRIMEKLRCYAEQVLIPAFLDVYIKEAGKSENFSGRKFKEFISIELGKINVRDVKKDSLKLSDYKDNTTGLHLAAKVLPISPDGIRSCHIGVIGSGAKFIKNEVYIHHSLYKAYAQLPVEKQPCLVILCPSTTFPINEHTMLNALLGTLALRVYQSIDRTAKVPEPEPLRKPDGFFQSRRNRKLSAVGLYKEKLAETGMEVDLEIYHNPFTVNPFKDFLFKGKGIRQLVKKNDQEMEWIN